MYFPLTRTEQEKFKADPSGLNWMTDDIRKQIQAQSELRRKLDCYGGNTAEWREWKSLRNRVNKNIINAKKEYLKIIIQHKM